MRLCLDLAKAMCPVIIAAGEKRIEAPIKKKMMPRIPSTMDKTLCKVEGGSLSGPPTIAALRAPMRLASCVMIFSGNKGIEVVCKEGSLDAGSGLCPPRVGSPDSAAVSVGAAEGAVGELGAAAAGGSQMIGSGKAIMELQTGHSTVVP